MVFTLEEKKANSTQITGKLEAQNSSFFLKKSAIDDSEKVITPSTI
jgi:hypothetical protein